MAEAYLPGHAVRIMQVVRWGPDAPVTVHCELVGPDIPRWDTCPIMPEFSDLSNKSPTLPHAAQWSQDFRCRCSTSFRFHMVSTMLQACLALHTISHRFWQKPQARPTRKWYQALVPRSLIFPKIYFKSRNLWWNSDPSNLTGLPLESYVWISTCYQFKNISD